MKSLQNLVESIKEILGLNKNNLKLVLNNVSIHKNYRPDSFRGYPGETYFNQ